MGSIADVDDQVIRLRMVGRTYRQIADGLGMSSPRDAQERYRAARARQIPPEFLPRNHPRPAPLVIAWAAGFLDGEGCIYGYENKAGSHGRFQFGVLVSQAVPEPIEELQRWWGGSVAIVRPKTARHQPQWRWGVRGRDAAAFLEDVLPHLRVKYRAAQAAIPCLYRIHAHRLPFTAEEIAERRSTVAILRETNAGKAGRRGVV